MVDYYIACRGKDTIFTTVDLTQALFNRDVLSTVAHKMPAIVAHL
jgi:hypothetical protein